MPASTPAIAMSRSGKTCGIFNRAAAKLIYYILRNVPMLNGGEEGTGQFLHEGRSPEWRNWKISQESRKAHPNSTTSGKISPRMGNKITTSGEATSGEFCTHEWGYFATSGGIGDVPWVTNKEFNPSLLCLMMELAFPYSESENALIKPVVPAALCPRGPS